MLLIPCPWCGPREEEEFRSGGEAGVTLPAQDVEAGSSLVASYLFFRSNPKGLFHERWYHAHGCRRWLSIQRSTITHEFESEPVAIGRFAPPRLPTEPAGEPLVSGR